MIEFIRAVVRPILVIGLGLDVSILALQGQPIPQEISLSFSALIAWWVADRSRRKDENHQ